MLLAVVAVSLAVFRPQSPPSRVVFRGNAITALDWNSRELWSHAYPGRLDAGLLPTDESLDHFVRIADLFGDGKREILLVAPYRTGPNPEDNFHVELDCFSESGQILWSYRPSEVFRFGTHDIDGPWLISSLFVSTAQWGPHIFVSVGQTPWGNSFVAQLDPHTGHATIRFVNTGSLYALNEVMAGSKQYLLIGGFNNEHDSGAVAVLDEATSFATSPQTRGTRHYCESCPSGSPDYYLVFPRSEINRVEGVYEDQVHLVDVHGTEIQATKSELHREDSAGAGTIYLMRLGSSVEPISLRYDSSYDMLHDKLTREGKLHHSLDRCPERLSSQMVRMWTPSAGWSGIQFPAAKVAE